LFALVLLVLCKMKSWRRIQKNVIRRTSCEKVLSSIINIFTKNRASHLYKKTLAKLVCQFGAQKETSP
jgi:hypothetical protein